MTVGNHLTGGGARLREAHAVDDVVETGLKKLEQDEAGDTTGLQSGLEVAAELALEHAVLEAEFLLLGEGGSVLGNLAAGALGAVHAGGIGLVLEGTCRSGEENAVATADFGFGSSVTGHGDLLKVEVGS